MASLRTPGVFNFSANFEALIAAPLDARLTVDTLAALTDGATIPYPYLGMIVAVTSDIDDNNGLYYCTDIGTSPSFASATTVWTVVGTGAGDIYVTGGTVSGTDLELTRNDGQTVVVDLSSIAGGGGTDSYVTGGTTSAATGGTTNITETLQFNNGKPDVTIDLSQALTFINNGAVKKTVGAINTGDFPFTGTGMTFQEIIQKIFYPVLPPSIGYSSASLSRSFGSLVEIGYTANLTLSAGFSRGSSVVAGQTTRYMGLPSSYNYTGDGITGTVTHTSTSLSDTDTVTSYAVTQGTNSWALSVSYSSVTPGGSTGPVYDDGTTYADTSFTNSGAKTSSASLEGVYPIYAATATTTVLTKQTLVSMLSANNLEYQIVAETAPGQHTFALPNAWTATRPLVGVYYFNTVSNSYDPANKISEWGTTSITETIQGNTVNYTQYTKLVGLPAAGTRKIKLVF